MYNDEKKAKFVELRSSGESFGKIEGELGISKRTAIAWSRQMEAEIAARKEELWDELMSRFRLTRRERVERLANLLDVIERLLPEFQIAEVKWKDLMKFYLQIEQRISKIAEDAGQGVEGSISAEHECDMAPIEATSDGAVPNEELNSVSQSA